MKNCKKAILIFLLFISFLNQILIFISIPSGDLTDSINEQTELNSGKKPLTSDVAGTDLYSERIAAYVAGSTSLIRQSLFTNDTNIISQFDTNDPAFKKCNIFFRISNGINIEAFPNILSENAFGTQFMNSYPCLTGFLFYDQDLVSSTAQSRANRAIEIIKRKFNIDLIMVNSTSPNLVPFVGYYPDWSKFLDELTDNIPKDGYWQVLDIDRLSGNNYIKNHHLSIESLFLNSLDDEFNITTDLLRIDSEFINYLLTGNMDSENTMEQSSFSLFDIFNDNETSVNGFTLSNNSHYTTLAIQYEGMSNGITKIDNNQYKFNLFNALGHKELSLNPSEKVYISLIGAFSSGIDINILGTDIINTTPNDFELSDFMLERLNSLLAFTDSDFDIFSLKDYTYIIYWINKNGLVRSYSRPVNLNNEFDSINFLDELGYQGLSYIPAGILNPISDLIITYNISNSESNMVITKELIGNNASYGASEVFEFNITAVNVGNTSVWGIPTNIPVDLELLFGESLYNELWTAVNDYQQYYYPTNQWGSLEEFLNLDEDPKLFHFDIWGRGVVDYYYPIVNFTNSFPYNQEMSNVIDYIYDNSGYYTDLVFIINTFFFGRDNFENLFTNEKSIWNEENWKLEPGEKITFITDNVSIANFDTFTAFNICNFTIKDPPNEKPYVKTGMILEGTTPQMALLNNTESWIIGSEKIASDPDIHELDIRFYFKNESYIDLINNTLDRVAININFTSMGDIYISSFEIFNYTTEEYSDMSPYFTSDENNTWTFSFFHENNDLKWLFDPNSPNNYTLRMRIREIDDNPFNISINNLDLSFTQRDNNIYEILPTKIIFASINEVQYERSSNSIILNTHKCASIQAISSLSNYNSRIGEINTYTLKLRNIGSDKAINQTISILVPGIIYDNINFTVNGNNLIYELENLEPSEEITLRFSFYTPNSGFIQVDPIYYFNPMNIENENTTKLHSTTNQLYFSAPVDYETRFPFLRTIEISYISSNMAPQIGNSFNLTVLIKNISPNSLTIPEINLTMNDYYGNLIRTDNNTLSISDIPSESNKTVFITLKKTDWKGYYYPSIIFFDGDESRTIRISKSLPIIIGDIDLSIDKSVNKNQIEIGEELKVTIEIENLGTISIKNLKLNDMASFSQIAFSLVNGKLINEVEHILPGEKKTYKYTIKAKIQTSITLKETLLEYYYLQKQEKDSNEVHIKISLSKTIQLMFIGVPCAIAGLLIGTYYRNTHKYKREKYELKRSERELFSLTSKESILKIEHTLRERIIVLDNKNNNYHPIQANQGGDSQE